MTDCKLCVHKPVCDLWRNEERQDASFFSRTDDECEFFLEERRWIPVTERLPDPGDRVLCVVKSFAFPGSKYYNILRYDRYGFNENGIYTDGVTHWMPIPEPPKEGAEG